MLRLLGSYDPSSPVDRVYRVPWLQVMTPAFEPRHWAQRDQACTSEFILQTPRRNHIIALILEGEKRREENPFPFVAVRVIGLSLATRIGRERIKRLSASPFLDGRSGHWLWLGAKI